MRNKWVAVLCITLLITVLTAVHAFAELPALSQPSGRYEGSVMVEITPPAEGASIVYTLDGSIPTMDNAQPYTEPLVFTESVCLRAACVTDGQVSEEIANACYVFSDSSLDIVSIIIDPDELWNSKTGIWADGDNIVKSSGYPYPNATYARVAGEKRDARAIYIPADTGRAAFNEAVQVCTEHNYGLYYPQKSLYVYAVDESFTTVPFDHPVPNATYGSFLLSNMDNDNFFTRIIEYYQNTLTRKYLRTNVMLLNVKPVIVYINGEYWGHYTMKEPWDAYTVARNAYYDRSFADLDHVEMARTHSGHNRSGSEEFSVMEALLERMSPGGNAEDRAYLDENVDIDSFLDCFALACFFGEQNSGTSIYYYRVGFFGKWKCCLQNNDLSLFQSSYNTVATFTDEAGIGLLQLNNTVFLKILEVEEYRDLFLTKLGSIWQTLTPEVMQAELDACLALIRPEMPAHFARWAPVNDPNIMGHLSSNPDEALAYWESRISRLRDSVIPKRPYYVYVHTQDAFQLTDEEMLHYFGSPAPENPEK